MASVGIGDKLGGRYFVLQSIPVVLPGTFAEVRDASGVVATAQFLRRDAIPAGSIDAVRAEVMGVPECPGLLRPEAVMASTGGIPCAIFLRPMPESLATRLSNRPMGSTLDWKVLVEGFARLCEDLAFAHAARAVHGAIALPLLHVTPADAHFRILLAGFGIDASLRAGRAVPVTAPRVDLAGAVLALRDALQAARWTIEGPSLARWTILASCAKAGDHPAFASGRSLAQALRELLPREPSKRSGAVVKVAPVDPVASRGSFESLPTPISPSPESPPPRHLPSRTVILAGVGVLAVAATVIGVSTTHRGPEPQGVSLTRSHLTARSCGAEVVANPAGLNARATLDQVDALCGDRGESLVLVGRAGSALLAGARQAVRGGTLAWGPVSLADSAIELGTTFVSTEGRWVAFRSDGAAPFGVVSVGVAPQPLPLALSGWNQADFRGAFLLHAGATGVALASTLSTPHGPMTVVIRADASGSARVYKIADGEVLAAVAGDPASLLVGSRSARGESLQAVNVPVATLPVLATLGSNDGGSGSDPRVAEIPAVSVQRSDIVMVDGQAVTAAPYGAGARFLVTASAAGASDGTVSLVTLPLVGHGEAGARVLSPHGRGMDLAARQDDGVVALVAQAGSVSEFLVAPTGETSTAVLTVNDAEHARIAACGAETWVAYSASRPRPRLAAVPLPCVSAR